MSSKETREFVCNNCGAEYILIFDHDEITDEPTSCPFCSAPTEDSAEMDVNGFGLDFDE